MSDNYTYPPRDREVIFIFDSGEYRISREIWTTERFLYLEQKTTSEDGSAVWSPILTKLARETAIQIMSILLASSEAKTEMDLMKKNIEEARKDIVKRAEHLNKRGNDLMTEISYFRGNINSWLKL